MNKAIPNPFPQLGTPNSQSVTIDPIGYELELKSIISTARNNIGSQSLLFPIIGRWGQGKSTILKYIENQNFTDCVIDKAELDEIGDFGAIIEYSYEKNIETNLTNQEEKSLILLIDEGQKLVRDVKDILDREDGQSSNKFEMFLEDLRSFANGNLLGNGKDSQICIFFGMHPEIYRNIKHYAPDNNQRIWTNVLELHDLNYYQAYSIVDTFLHSRNMEVDRMFDESIIYTIYSLLPHLNKKLEGIERYNGRLFAQIFFKLFELWQNSRRKLELNDLKQILIREQLKINNVHITFPDGGLHTYQRIKSDYTYLKQDELLNQIIFNPVWRPLDNLSFDIENMKDLLNIRAVYLVDIEKYMKIRQNLELELFDEFDGLNKEEIFLKGKRTKIVFSEQHLISKELDEKVFIANKLQKKQVYRLNDVFIEKIFGSIPGTKSEYTDVLKKYYDSQPKGKIRQVFNGLKRNQSNILTRKKIKDYDHGNIEYLLLSHNYYKDTDTKFAIFYYPTGWDSTIDDYIKMIKDRLINDFETDIISIFIGPYVSDQDLEVLKSDPTLAEFRNLKNRIFFDKVTKEKLGKILKHNSIEIISELVDNSMPSYFTASINEGYQVPFTGLKITRGSIKLPREQFFIDIKESIKIKKDELFSYDLVKLVDYDFLLHGFQTDSSKSEKFYYMKRFPEVFIIETISKFFKIDINSHVKSIKIKSPKISIYERNFLSLVDNLDKIRMSNFKQLMKRYYNFNSRVTPDEFIKELLKVRKIIKEESNYLIFIKPSQLENQIEAMIQKKQNLLLEHDELRVFEKCEEKYQVYQKKSAQLKKEDFMNISIMNTFLIEIKNALEELFGGEISIIDVLKEIVKYQNSIKEILNKPIIKYPAKYKIEDLCNVKIFLGERDSEFQEIVDILAQDRYNDLRNSIGDLNSLNVDYNNYFNLYLFSTTLNRYGSDEKILEKLININKLVSENYFNYIFDLKKIESENIKDLSIGTYLKDKNPKALIDIHDTLRKLKDMVGGLFSDLEFVNIPNLRTRPVDEFLEDIIDEIEEFNDYLVHILYMNSQYGIDFLKILKTNFFDDSDKKIFSRISSKSIKNVFISRFLDLAKHGKYQEYLKQIYAVRKSVQEIKEQIIIKYFVKDKIVHFGKYLQKKTNKKMNFVSERTHLDKIQQFIRYFNAMKKYQMKYFLFIIILFLKHLQKNQVENLDFADDDLITSYLESIENHPNLRFDDLYRDGLFVTKQITECYYQNDELKKNQDDKISPRFDPIVDKHEEIMEDYTLNTLMEQFNSFRANLDTPDKVIVENWNIKKIQSFSENFNFKKLLDEFLYSDQQIFNEKLGKSLDITKSDLIEIITLLKDDLSVLEEDLSSLFGFRHKIKIFQPKEG